MTKKRSWHERKIESFFLSRFKIEFISFHYFFKKVIENFRQYYMCKQWQRTRSQTDLYSLHKILIFLFSFFLSFLFKFDAIDCIYLYVYAAIPHVWIICTRKCKCYGCLFVICCHFFIQKFIPIGPICNVLRKIWKQFREMSKKLKCLEI